ncbi:hypothetical protein HOY34_14450 [Xinfangfangia sp. D13-10-4-6]|uniref:hypothetical protein n=1 Tax=Pseudogemmobacter hezensis TaxID=2737662 RepID=UPI001558026B|nr:hypothetical protein [Pseudogemmobacter hezensis]NPD16397.1 hypothetical protein [Pseudogemmobacter hezensis]
MPRNEIPNGRVSHGLCWWFCSLAVNNSPAAAQMPATAFLFQNGGAERALYSTCIVAICIQGADSRGNFTFLSNASDMPAKSGIKENIYAVTAQGWPPAPANRSASPATCLMLPPAPPEILTKGRVAASESALQERADLKLRLRARKKCS